MSLEEIIQKLTDLINKFLNHKHTGTDSQKLVASDLGLGTIATENTPLSISKGGTGQTTQTTAFDALAPTTTNGDIIYRGVSNNQRLPGGTSGQVLHGGGPSFSAVVEGDFAFTDNSTANSATNQHGLLKKLDNDPNHFMDGTGNWSTPSAGVLVASGSNITVSNTTTETDIFSYTVPANSLATANKGYRVKLWISNLKNSTNSVDLYFKYGAGSFLDTNFGSQAINRPGIWECIIINDGASNAQRAAQSFFAAVGGIAVGNINWDVQTNPFTVDSTASQTLKCSVKFTAATVNDTINIAHYTVEKLS